MAKRKHEQDLTDREIDELYADGDPALHRKLERESQKENPYANQLFTFTDKDLDVKEIFEKICFVFEVHKEGYTWANVDEMKKYHDLLEKGCRISDYQKRRVDNAYFFAKEYHERVMKLSLELAEAIDRSNEQNNEQFSMFSSNRCNGNA